MRNIYFPNGMTLRKLLLISVVIGQLFTAQASAQLLNTGDVLSRLPQIDTGLDSPIELPGDHQLIDQQLLDEARDRLVAVTGLGILPPRLEISGLLQGSSLIEVEVENGWRAIEHEWLLLVDNAGLTRVQNLDVEIVENNQLSTLAMSVLRIRVNPAQDNYRSLKNMLAKGEVSLFDRNHVFSAQSTVGSTTNVPPVLAPQLRATDAKKLHSAKDNLRIGMIDTAVNTEHPALSSAGIISKSFVEEGMPEAQAHGTAIASLIVGSDTVQGFLPDAQLFAASAFYTRDGHSQGATSSSLLQALDWLLAQKVSVINMSLAGPPNQLLEQAINVASKKGVLIVAAVGNAGPAAGPLYPAAWETVVAVTAVDENKKIYRWAVQGEQVDFSARGVRVKVARIPDTEALESGTSLAATVLSSLLAIQLADTKNKTVAQVLDQLALRSQDLGKEGKDKVFGFGYLSAEELQGAARPE